MKPVFSAVILAVVGVASCAKDASRKSEPTPESVVTRTPAQSANTPPPPPTSAPTAPDPAAATATEAPARQVPAARPKPIEAPAPQKDSYRPSAIGTSQAGRVVRFACPGGEVPTQVMGGCMCGSEIANPCGPGVRVPELRVEGKTCLFTCP